MWTAELSYREKFSTPTLYELNSSRLESFRYIIIIILPLSLTSRAKIFLEWLQFFAHFSFKISLLMKPQIIIITQNGKQS